MRIWSGHMEVTQMKLWILTAVLAVALIGGVATATFDDGGTSDGTVAVDTLDIDSALVALTIDADQAHQQKHPLIDRSSGVPVFAGVITRVFANATLNEPVDDFKRRLSQHSGKTYADDKRTNTTSFAVRLALAAHPYPLLC